MLPALEQTKPGRFITAEAVNPWDVEAVEVEVSGVCSGGRLEWLYTRREGLMEILEYADEVPATHVQDAPTFAKFAGGETRGEAQGTTSFWGPGLLSAVVGGPIRLSRTESAGGLALASNGRRNLPIAQQPEHVGHAGRSGQGVHLAVFEPG